MTDQEVKLQLAEIIGTWLGAMAVVIGGLFGMFQYLEHKSAVRVDRTMAFVERYHANNLLIEARMKVTDVIVKRVEEINEILIDPDIPPENLEGLYNARIVKIVKEESLSAALEQLFTFYEQILLCRDLELCEGFVAEKFFDTDGRAFMRTFYPYICAIRKEWNNPEQYAQVVTYYLGDSAKICANSKQSV